MKKPSFKKTAMMLLFPALVAATIVVFRLLERGATTPSSHVEPIAPATHTPLTENDDFLSSSSTTALQSKQKLKAELERRWLSNLKISGHPQDAIVAAAIGNSEALLIDALALAPDDPMLHFFIAEHCQFNPEASICGIDVNARLANSDPDNAMVDLLEAEQALALAKPDSALAHLRSAADKSAYNDYSYAFIASVGESMTRAGIAKSPAFLQSVIGHWAALSSKKEANLLSMCRDHAGEVAWRSACKDLGHMIWESNAGQLAKGIIQGVLQEVEDPTQVAQMLVEAQEQQDAFFENSEQLQILWSIEPDWQMTDLQWQAFLADFKQGGVEKAFKGLVDSEFETAK